MLTSFAAECTRMLFTVQLLSASSAIISIHTCHSSGTALLRHAAEIACSAAHCTEQTAYRMCFARAVPTPESHASQAGTLGMQQSTRRLRLSQTLTLTLQRQKNRLPLGHGNRRGMLQWSRARQCARGASKLCIACCNEDSQSMPPRQCAQLSAIVSLRAIDAPAGCVTVTPVFLAHDCFLTVQSAPPPYFQGSAVLLADVTKCLQARALHGSCKCTARREKS